MCIPIFVRPLTDTERDALMAGLRSADAFTLRRCQILLASALSERAAQIAHALGCDDQTVRNAIHAFNQRGLDALTEDSSRPHCLHAVFDAVTAERLRSLLHQSPLLFGKPTSVWTLNLAAAVCVSEGVTDARVSDETIRATLRRMRVRWQRAKHWITSPDPGYTRKKATRPADSTGDDASRLGTRLRRRSVVEPGRATETGELGQGKDAAVRGGWSPGERDHDAVPRLVLRTVGGTGENGVAAGLGQCQLACQQGSAGVDRAPQSEGQARRGGDTDRVVFPAGEEPVAQPDRAEVDARQAVDRRTGAIADDRRDRGARLRMVRLSARTAPSFRRGLLIEH